MAPDMNLGLDRRSPDHDPDLAPWPARGSCGRGL